MLENSQTPAAQSQIPAAESANLVKRYAPPNQRNRLNRRKSADKNQVFASRNAPLVDHGDAGSSSLPNENLRARLVALEGCSASEASQLMNDRWAAAMQTVNDPSIDPSERPVVYAEKVPSAWGGQFKLPHQLMSPTGGPPSPGPQMDFLAELRRAKANAGVNPDS